MYLFVEIFNLNQNENTNVYYFEWDQILVVAFPKLKKKIPPKIKRMLNKKLKNSNKHN